ncbi:caspase family protein [Accumulibacter sp.]|uniref:caspase family protein n=1 Tax=Accumulibacter sp. TaxID=2053492 RepID=UPI00287B4407|nr:caspase family protein [Accumulibacter sp.]MDS4054079.1 caspase family protein [Accumulibacter sp.]HMW62432.1 caspase family protein [Accumulibacter sp.]HMW79527.1 caspase family protein [Accumulibacter sp.]HMX67827.1 caspase family protein [Accumulibacter sp.]HNC26125.1 caspase family protein [Accumulibacter sp.]
MSGARARGEARRLWLQQASALAGASLLPLPATPADEVSTLHALPRLALVIGNTRYGQAPLNNPANDARAIANELQRIGFKLSLRLDASRQQMSEAIDAFCTELARSRGVGIFYYAGHGAQLAWRNYLIPVDALLDKLADLQTKTIELNSLLAGLKHAKNRMNIIILDACRDNPFGTRLPIEQPGLSQFDAPPGSLLAYATAPGNTASDGDGVNGLYTESLLREMKVPETRIEDVFKRVRLAVRRRSDGQQIPWESTSLDDDFYFLPPQQLRRQSEIELERLFNEELALWQTIRLAQEPAPLESYLRRYPSGKFSELAQFRLDRLLKARGEKAIVIQAAKDNPFSKGSARVDTQFKVGERWSYREIDLFTKLELRRFTNRVSAITESEVLFNDGSLVTDLLGNFIKRPPGWQYTGAQFYIQEYALGKRWSTRFRVLTPNGFDSETEIDFRVVEREEITVPAGTFTAYRVEGDGWGRAPRGVVKLRVVYWVAPEIKRVVASDTKRSHFSGSVLNNERLELTACTQF